MPVIAAYCRMTRIAVGEYILSLKDKAGIMWRKLVRVANLR